MALLQNFHGFAARNIGINKNGELAETKINLRLNQNKTKKIPGKHERYYSSEVLENFARNQRDPSDFQYIQKFV